MTKEEAFGILGVQEEEDVLDVWEEKCFEFKDYLFRNTFVEKLISSKLNRLALIEEAASLFTELPSQSVFQFSKKDTPAEPGSELLGQIRAYEIGVAQLKLKLSQAQTLTNLKLTCAQLAQLELFYMDAMRQNFNLIQTVQVSVADKIDTALLLQLIQNKTKEVLEADERIQKELARIEKIRALQ